jgi:hypothetical protein
MRQWVAWALRFALAAALLYVTWVFYGRWEARRNAAAAAEEAERTRARDELHRAGGDALKIAQFYASPASVTPGQPAELCYGVLFAATVVLTANPPGEKLDDVWPSLQRCIPVRPKTDTEYTLRAIDKSGAAVEQMVKVKVLSRAR